jgi:hypothetical protein
MSPVFPTCLYFIPGVFGFVVAAAAAEAPPITDALAGAEMAEAATTVAAAAGEEDVIRGAIGVRLLPYSAVLPFSLLHESRV